MSRYRGIVNGERDQSSHQLPSRSEPKVEIKSASRWSRCQDSGEGRGHLSSNWSNARPHFAPHRQAIPASRKVDDSITRPTTSNGVNTTKTAAAVTPMPLADTNARRTETHIRTMATANIHNAAAICQRTHERGLCNRCGCEETD